MRDGAQKSVKVAPVLRLLTDRQYRVRQPLVTAQRTATLKKTHTEHCTQQLQCDVRTEERSPEGIDQSPAHGTTEQSPAHGTKDQPPAFGTTDQPPSHGTTDQPPPHGTTDQPPPNRAHSLSHSRRTSPLLSSTHPPDQPRSVLQIQRLKTPVRPQLSSTVLYPTYTPRYAHRKTHTDPQQSTLRYQAEYWACAIPTPPPPTSSGGHPDRDYQALLDYTYPLRPGPQPGQLSPTYCTFQDSGIEVDLGQSKLNLSFSGPEQAEGRCVGQRSSETPLSHVEHVLSQDTLNWCKQDNSEAAGPWCPPLAALVTLPLDKGGKGDWGDSEEEDMEFRPLPKQLEQFQQLSTQVREMTACLISAHWDPPARQDTPNTDEEKHCSADMAALRTEATLKTDVTLSRRLEQGSLMEHINVFCCHLEQLIHRLYITSQKIQVLLPPTVDIHSVKSALAHYQCFQREVRSHLPLTSSVLRTGHLLLSSIQTTSPVLRDALRLVENQSKLLERHTEHFFSSILSATDTLTQAKAAAAAPHRSTHQTPEVTVE